MKRLIQNCLIATLLTFSGSVAEAQWAVFDSSNFAQTVKIAEQAANQTKYLTDTYKEIKKANEILTKISTQLSNISMIGEIIQEQVNLVGRASTTINNMRKYKNANPQIISNFTKDIDGIMLTNKSNIAFLKEFMRDGLSMSDGERLTLAMNIRKETKAREKELQAIDGRARVIFETVGFYKTLK